jgi:hypothetical protein
VIQAVKEIIEVFNLVVGQGLCEGVHLVILTGAYRELHRPTCNRQHRIVNLLFQ